MDLLEEVVGIDDPEAIEHRSDILGLIFVHESGIRQPLREGVVEVVRADVHAFAAESQPEFGTERGGAIAPLVVGFADAFKDIADGFGVLVRIFAHMKISRMEGARCGCD